MNIGRKHAWLSFALAGLLAACGSESPSESIVDFPPTAGGKADIGGVPALGSSLNAIGTVGMQDDSGQYFFFCTATLIGPTTVLTAKHCAEVLSGPLMGMKLVNLEPIYFAVGPDANHPLRTVEAVAADLSPLDDGGFVGLGNDVAIYHLIEPITDVTPFEVADFPLTDAVVGKRFVGLGYGAKDIYEDLTGQLEAHRRIGTKTLRALSGKSFELMLGSLDAFVSQLEWVYGKDVVEANMDLIQQWYDQTVLFDGYEVWAGHAAGDSQSCHGDSGGPLIGRVATSDGSRRNAIFGVVSGGWFSRDLTCDYGTFYASIGDATQELIQQALTWTDPCADVTVQGHCEGDEAVRCTGKWEGNRRLTQVDCSFIGQTCGTDDAGQVACVDPGTTPAHVDPANGRVAPDISEVRADVMRASRQGYLHPVVQRLDSATDTGN